MSNIPMNLLLLLSALLSALTGVAAGVRSTPAPQTIACGVEAIPVAPRRAARAAMRPSAGADFRAVLRRRLVDTPPLRVVHEAIWMGRRRE